MSNRWYALLAVPLIGAALVCAALAQVWDMWFADRPVFAGFWAMGGLIPYLLCFLGILVSLRAGASVIAIAGTAAAALLMLPALVLSTTFGEGTLALLTFLPVYTWTVLMITLVVVGLGSALALRRKKAVPYRE